ncbi:uncharacterized protein AMSG_05265 [Thecamonas trahens ATCC 50062]|uniref:Uncharacterized protein n=1 Tax=Thecamonas trahens ATCC 50062 TaxID=461836 RepID=A0A0L0DAK4_THETB|nr:hypothetical protein AMSG_05265 [Thecamonas trahens ATCC 50062]KNC49270.1 hypothetical protein AMSG_05265 [Thecamonas trahens ATCC 50062]|eukprot:XP_013757984.1 hypothetical protein AMSG_05265 [Thecamonas trahens ATCC 50062]
MASGTHQPTVVGLPAAAVGTPAALAWSATNAVALTARGAVFLLAPSPAASRPTATADDHAPFRRVAAIALADHGSSAPSPLLVRERALKAAKTSRGQSAAAAAAAAAADTAAAAAAYAAAAAASSSSCRPWPHPLGRPRAFVASVWGPLGSDGRGGCALALLDSTGAAVVYAPGPGQVPTWLPCLDLSAAVFDHLLARNEPPPPATPEPDAELPPAEPPQRTNKRALADDAPLARHALSALAWSRELPGSGCQPPFSLLATAAVDSLVIFAYTPAERPVSRSAVAVPKLAPVAMIELAVSLGTCQTVALHKVTTMDITDWRGHVLVAVGTATGVVAVYTFVPRLTPASELALTLARVVPLYRGSPFAAVTTVRFSPPLGGSSSPPPHLAFALPNTVAVWASAVDDVDPERGLGQLAAPTADGTICVMLPLPTCSVDTVVCSVCPFLPPAAAADASQLWIRRFVAPEGITGLAWEVDRGLFLRTTTRTGVFSRYTPRLHEASRAPEKTMPLPVATSAAAPGPVVSGLATSLNATHVAYAIAAENEVMLGYTRSATAPTKLQPMAYFCLQRCSGPSGVLDVDAKIASVLRSSAPVVALWDLAADLVARADRSLYDAVVLQLLDVGIAAEALTTASALPPNLLVAPIHARVPAAIRAGRPRALQHAIFLMEAVGPSVSLEALLAFRTLYRCAATTPPLAERTGASTTATALVADVLLALPTLSPGLLANATSLASATVVAGCQLAADVLAAMGDESAASAASRAAVVAAAAGHPDLTLEPYKAPQRETCPFCAAPVAYTPREMSSEGWSTCDAGHPLERCALSYGLLDVTRTERGCEWCAARFASANEGLSWLPELGSAACPVCGLA